MILIDKVYGLVKSNKWEEFLQYLDDSIALEAENQNLQKRWLTDYSEEKLLIISQLSSSLESLKSTNSSDLPTLQQTVLKSFAKGLLLPELSHFQDTSLITSLITHSQNTKYLFMLFQQNLCQIKQLYHHSYLTSVLDKVTLKTLSVIPSFLKLLGQVIFGEVVQKFHEFYTQYDRVVGEENVIGEEDKQIQEFGSSFVKRTLEALQKLLNQANENSTFEILRQKQIQRKHLFGLLKFLHFKVNSNEEKLRIKNFLDLIIYKLNIPFTELPSFWISQHMQEFASIYDTKTLFYLYGTILITQLPNRPEYSKISSHLISFLHFVCSHLFTTSFPITSLSFNQNPTFFIDLFERFSILMGLLSKENEEQKQISMMLNAILNKKNLFSTPVLTETLWRQLILKHDDMNFRMFCMSQYKKVLTLSTKELEKSCTHVLTHGFNTIFKLVTQLEANSNSQFIGFHITLVIYFLACLNKFLKFYSSESQQSTKSQLIFTYFFSEEKVKQIKQKFKETLFKLKESLKDRLEVFKMKNPSQKNEQQQKQANEVSICIYRIQQEIKFE